MKHSCSRWTHQVSTCHFHSSKPVIHFCLVLCSNNFTNITLLNLFNVSTISYRFYSYSYKTCDTSATITFAFRHDVDSWCLDDVAVWNGSYNMLVNGGFETGNYSSWKYRDPINSGNGGQVTNGYLLVRPRTGNYAYIDGMFDSFDYLSQTFETIPNYRYNISFWLRSSAYSTQSNQLITAHVSITPWMNRDLSWCRKRGLQYLFGKKSPAFIGVDIHIVIRGFG